MAAITFSLTLGTIGLFLKLEIANMISTSAFSISKLLPIILNVLCSMVMIHVAACANLI